MLDNILNCLREDMEDLEELIIDDIDYVTKKKNLKSIIKSFITDLKKLEKEI